MRLPTKRELQELLELFTDGKMNWGYRDPYYRMSLDKKYGKKAVDEGIKRYQKGEDLRMNRKTEQVVEPKVETMPVVAQALDSRIKTLESFKEELKVMPTDQLVAGYLKVRDFDTRLKQLKDAVRAELVDPERGRIFVDETVEEDERGHRYLMGSDGNELLAQKRVSFVLNEEKAEEVLKSKTY